MRPANHQVRRKCRWLDLQKKKDYNHRRVNEENHDGEEKLNSARSVRVQKKIKKIRCLFFSRKPTGSPTFPSCWGSLFDIFVAGPLLGTKNRWTKLFRGHGKKPTSIDVSSTPMRFKSCQPAFQGDFFAFSRSFFFVCFSPAAQEIDNRLETPSIFI